MFIIGASRHTLPFNLTVRVFSPLPENTYNLCSGKDNLPRILSVICFYQVFGSQGGESIPHSPSSSELLPSSEVLCFFTLPVVSPLMQQGRPGQSTFGEKNKLLLILAQKGFQKQLSDVTLVQRRPFHACFLPINLFPD